MTAKPSICNSGGDVAVDAFCKSGAYARKDSCITTGDLRGAWWQLRAMLGDGQPALKTEQKSAEGIVGRGLPSEGPNAASAERLSYG